MARDGRIKLHELLPIVVARLIEEIDALNEATCFISLNPQAHPDPTPGDYWVTVTPGGGKFDEAQWDGAGRFAATVDTTFTVTVHCGLQLDEAGRDAQFLQNASLGVLVLIDGVLEALAGYDPVDINDAQVLREALMPNGWNDPERREPEIGSIGMVFTAKFDWDLVAV